MKSSIAEFELCSLKPETPNPTIESSFSEFEMCSFIPETPESGMDGVKATVTSSDQSPSVHASVDGDPLPPPVVVPYVHPPYQPFIEAAMLEFDPRFSVLDAFHEPSMKALLKIWLPLMFKPVGSGSKSEHAGVKVTVKDSDQLLSVQRSMDGIEEGSGSKSEHAGVKVTLKDSDYDDEVNFVSESEEVDGEPLYPKMVA